MADLSTENYRLIEYDDYWLIPLQGGNLVRICIGYELRLELMDQSSGQTAIWIGGKTRMEIAGNVYDAEGDDPKTLGPAVLLWNQSLERAVAHKDGRLELTFRGGDSLYAYPLEKTESWGLTGQKWLRIVCMAGGELAVWQAD